MLMIVSAKSYGQKFFPGRFTDTKGNTENGYIRINPSPNGPIKDEGFIEFKEDDKSNPFKLTATELKDFVIGKDSFVVAHPPQNESWGKNEIDFVRVALDEDIKIYVIGSGGGGSGNGKRGLAFQPGISTGIGTGGFGTGLGAGISIPIGGGGGGNGNYARSAWYYGANTAEMKRITNDNFEDVLSDIMGDFPEVVDRIHAKVYILENIDRLIAYFKQVVAANKK